MADDAPQPGDRLARIIERNQKRGRAKEPAPAPAPAKDDDRLGKIIARNTPPPWYRNKVLRAAIIGVLVIVVLVLALATDLSTGNVKRAPKAPAAGSGDRYVPGVLMRSPNKR